MLGPIDTIRVFTTDLPKAIAFYRDALEMKLAISDETMAIFANGETKLMLEAIDPQDEDEAIELVGRLRISALLMPPFPTKRCDLTVARSYSPGVGHWPISSIQTTTF